MELLLLLVDLDLWAVKKHIVTFDDGELGSAHGTLQLRLTPFVDAWKTKLMVASVNLGHIVLAVANAALKNGNGGSDVISLAHLE